MKVILINVMLTLASQISWSQQTFDWKSLFENAKTAKLEQFLTSFDSVETVSIYDYYNRTLTTSFNERVIFMEESYGYDSTKTSWRINSYLISVIQGMDSIVFAQVDTLKSSFYLEKEPGSVPVFQFESANLMQKVEEEFKQIYRIGLKRDELFNLTIRFGLRCGRGSWQTSEYSEISNYVDKKQINKLREYLTSTCLEMQLFGIQGFYELKTEENYSIKPEDQRLIDVILSKSGKAIYCRGCGVLTVDISNLKEKFGF